MLAVAGHLFGVDFCGRKKWPPFLQQRQCQKLAPVVVRPGGLNANPGSQKETLALAALTEQDDSEGFEPLRAEPNGFLVHLLGHSDTLSWHSFYALCWHVAAHLCCFCRLVCFMFPVFWAHVSVPNAILNMCGYLCFCLFVCLCVCYCLPISEANALFNKVFAYVLFVGVVWENPFNMCLRLCLCVYVCVCVCVWLFVYVNSQRHMHVFVRLLPIWCVCVCACVILPRCCPFALFLQASLLYAAWILGACLCSRFNLNMCGYVCLHVFVCLSVCYCLPISEANALFNKNLAYWSFVWVRSKKMIVCVSVCLCCCCCTLFSQVVALLVCVYTCVEMRS